MAKGNVEEQLTALRALKADVAPANSAGEADTAASRLRPFLKHANNLVVARAADLAREVECRVLLPELVAAFHKFLAGPEKNDSQCWAKNALSKALHHLGCVESALYLAGMRVHQYEPVWGGQSDVAGVLRANCAHALIDCHEIPHQVLLLHLLELVADADKAVRAEAMRAIAQAGGESAILLLRLRALTAAGEEPEVMGQCYAGLLALEGASAVPFLASFLRDQDDQSAEAAVALGETRTPEALEALLACFKMNADGVAFGRPGRGRFGNGLEPVFAAVLLSSIALTRQPQAIEELLALVKKESSHAEDAIEALANAGFGTEVQAQLAAIVASLDNARITRAFNRHFPGDRA